MKTKYHKFTGDIPIVFVEDAIKFLQGMGVETISEMENYEPAFMHDVKFGPVHMVVFSESMLRTLYGDIREHVIESHLALWAGTQKYPTNEIAALKYGMRIAERYNREKTYEILRLKLQDRYGIASEEMNTIAKADTSKSITQVLFKESASSDKHELAIAKYVNSLDGINAERPSVSSSYSDVKLTTDAGQVAWLEVKMNHTDNLSNPRVFFDGTKWDTTYTTPAAKFAVKELNSSSEVKDFIKAIKKFAGLSPNKKITLPTTKSGLKESTAIPLKVMLDYFSQPGVDRYILRKPNVNLGKLVTDHYTKGKAEPAYYMQAGDDFYLISSTNPLGLPSDIPVLKGKGEFKVRIATRSAFYEIQAEIKITDMPNSKYSVLKGTSKKNPFEKLAQQRRK